MVLIILYVMAAPLLLAKNERVELELLPALANRHGLITGATGTGKTVTMQALAQRLSSAARAIGSELGRQIMRGLLGSILGGGRRR
jgi:type II secretory ATPase GspE/PulE/Tfp pilus assembly ATPase PilB-like protein